MCAARPVAPTVAARPSESILASWEWTFAQQQMQAVRYLGAVLVTLDGLRGVLGSGSRQDCGPKKGDAYHGL